MSNNPSYNYIQDIVHFILQQNIYVMDIIYLPLFKIKYTILNYLHNILYNMQNRMINQFNILLLELYCLIPIQNLNRLLYIMIHIIFNQYYIKHMDIILPFHHIYFLSYNSYLNHQDYNNTYKNHCKYILFYNSHFNLINKHIFHYS